MKPIAAALAVVCAVALGGCETRTQDPAPQTGPLPSADPEDVTEHESGPQSPISYGLEVPEGATQLGPLVRYRSDELIEAFRPELDAREAAREAAQEEEAQESGEPTATPTPSASSTPATRPSDDTFSGIERPPRPDVTMSLMRVDGDPTEVLRLMIAQVNTVVPTAELAQDDLSEHCEATERRITSCTIDVTGETADDREVRITVTMAPGEVSTRTAYPASNLSPVLTVRAQYVGDPRSGQLEPRAETVDVPREIDGEDTSDLIWPSMDLEGDRGAELLPGWSAPDPANLLLTSEIPPFVAIAADRVREADEIAEDFVARVGEPTKDVVEDLNEISTTYTATTDDGREVRSVFVLSARGSYAVLFAEPPVPGA